MASAVSSSLSQPGPCLSMPLAPSGPFLCPSAPTSLPAPGKGLHSRQSLRLPPIPLVPEGGPVTPPPVVPPGVSGDCLGPSKLPGPWARGLVSWVLPSAVELPPYPAGQPLHPPPSLSLFSRRGPAACSATTWATTRATAGAPSPRPSPPSAPCTSARQATARGTPSPPPTRNWWTPPSPPAATHPRAPTPTSTTPTTPPWAAAPAPRSTPVLSAPWRPTGPPCPLPSGCSRPLGGTAPRGKLGARRVLGGAFGRQTHLLALKLGWTTAAAETPARGQVDAQGGTVAPLASTCPEVPASRQGRGALARPLRCLRPGDTAVSAPLALLKSLPKSGLGANWDGTGPPSSRGPFGGALTCSSPAWGDSWSSCQRLQPPGLSFLPLSAPR